MKLVSRNRSLDLSGALVMGVLNVTPDSFSDGGRLFDAGGLDIAAAVEAGLALARDGAAVVDVGGESTRPGSPGVSVGDELARVIPVIEGLRRATDAWISIDTSKPDVMRAAAGAGADLINDVRALRAPGALEVAAATGLAVCLMHMQGEPATMQVNPVYEDVVGEVRAFLAQRIADCIAAGIAAAGLVVDPGFGFGKTQAHNLELLRALPRFAEPGSPPLLVGVSRKSMLGRLTGRPTADRLAAGLGVAALAVQAGARIIRTHDVAPTVDVLRVLAAVRDPLPAA